VDHENSKRMKYDHEVYDLILSDGDTLQHDGPFQVIIRPYILQRYSENPQGYPCTITVDTSIVMI
jgi:hypothetical protein